MSPLINLPLLLKNVTGTQCVGQYGVVLGGTGSDLGGSGWYFVVQGQYGVVLVGTWWYWVSTA